ncbi:MAG: class I SAM-dependent methyltransferase [Elusimicrobia bacterium]|nr:class I SAM-dependent methyltransferase [Elusimicrobiota bacterium]
MKASDACGRSFTDFYRNKARFEVIERDDGHISATDGRAWYLSGFARWPARERKAMSFVRGRVLDIGCGMGRHALHLQKKGFSVTGLDLSPANIRLCRLRGLKRTLCMPVEGIAGLRRGSFDTLLMMGNNFGLFSSFKKARKLLREMLRITSEGARIIAETLDPYRTQEPDHLAYHKRNRRRGRMGGQVRIRVRYAKSVGPWHDYLFVSRKELVRILEGTGWRLWKTFRSGGPQYAAVIRKLAGAQRGRSRPPAG